MACPSPTSSKPTITPGSALYDYYWDSATCTWQPQIRITRLPPSRPPPVPPPVPPPLPPPVVVPPFDWWNTVALLVVPAAAAIVGIAAAATSEPREHLGQSESPKKRCFAVVQVGRRRHPRYSKRRGFKMCLTPTQFEKLFPGVARIPRGVWPKARCGLFGCAYPRGVPGTREGKEVVKFTSNRDEALAANRLKRRPVSGALPVFDVFRLKYEGLPVWAIRSTLLPQPRGLSQALGRCQQTFSLVQSIGGPNNYITFLGCIDRMANRLGIRTSPSKIENFGNKFLDTVKDLEAEGIYWSDLHPGNVTEDEVGDPVILDVGPYWLKTRGEPGATAEEEQEVPQLAGRGRGRRRR